MKRLFKGKKNELKWLDLNDDNCDFDYENDEELSNMECLNKIFNNVDEKKYKERTKEFDMYYQALEKELFILKALKHHHREQYKKVKRKDYCLIVEAWWSEYENELYYGHTLIECLKDGKGKELYHCGRAREIMSIESILEQIGLIEKVATYSTHLYDDH